MTKATVPAFTPEAFGAAGDGRTDDTVAIYRAATAALVAGGGTVAFRPRTYRIFSHGTYWLSGLGDFTGVPIRLLGNGATLAADTANTWRRADSPGDAGGLRRCLRQGLQRRGLLTRVAACHRP